MNELYKELKKYGSVKANIPLSRFSTFKIGGQAEFLVEVKENDALLGLLNFLNEQAIEFFVFGGGSNLLLPDDGLKGVVIKIATPEVKVEQNTIETQAGVPLATIVGLATKNGLSGLEWAMGIPGTIGGAIRGNAGALGESLADCIQKVFVWENGEVKEFDKKDCGFSYRNSFFKQNKNIVILKAIFVLKLGEKCKILAKINENLISRNKFPKFPSAGSFFKNIKIEKWPGDVDMLPEIFRTRGTVPAGWLIENCGLKGFKIGDAGVSQEHGNFLVNFGSATQNDVLQVVEEIQKKVYNKYGVSLEPEVQIVAS
ncbi:MAG: UDP-N-acetylmuramate dehydrogenase [Candidatus Magasanikbacteria bacterium]|nr:UDP-N-acetylmuramate dehydrogenase [Candidatus Magasanikbacteria bacterium]